MPALAWQISVFGVLGVSLVVVAARTLAIARRPIHLRWELAPIPQVGEKGGYGGSHLEDYEWWNKPHRKATAAALIYIAKEMFLLRSVWRNNRGLWPLTLAMHYGLYLMVGVSFAILLVNVLPKAGLDPLALQPLRDGISGLVLLGYLLGSVGAVGLLLKRLVDPGLRSVNAPSRYYNLIFLMAVFLSGCYAWLCSADYAAEVSRFARSLIAPEPSTAPAFPLSFHIGVSLLFLLYMPLTDMIHFVTKYFTYHTVLWDDRPQTGAMEREVRGLLAQPVTWSAPHIASSGQRNWAALSASDENDEATS